MDLLRNHPPGSAGFDATQRSTPPFRLPPGCQKRADKLLEQQFWLWGCDIRRPQGNILTHLGFEKLKAPLETGLATSQYRCPLGLTSTITLWGFGACLGDEEHGFLFVPRAGWHPRWCLGPVDTASAWDPAWFDRLPLLVAGPNAMPCHQQVLRLIDWIAWYESRVLEIAGPDYRRQTITAWKRPVTTAAPLEAQWRDLGMAIVDASTSRSTAAWPAHLTLVD